jgi:hypothetical protein
LHELYNEDGGAQNTRHPSPLHFAPAIEHSLDIERMFL